MTSPTVAHDDGTHPLARATSAAARLLARDDDPHPHSLARATPADLRPPKPSAGASTLRIAVLWIPDWPVVVALDAALADPCAPLALANSRQVTTVSAQARARGVRRGMRRRAAQEQCPELLLIPADPSRDARAFESIAALVEDLAPGVEVLRPGLLLTPSRGASRYHGSDEALAEHILTQLAERIGVEAQVGIADGLLAGILAARQGVIVPPGASPAYLAPHPITALRTCLAETERAPEIDTLLDLLLRLGIGTLGALGDLPAKDVTARFGATGIWARRLATARDAIVPASMRPEQQFVAMLDCDPPLESVETAAFVARRLAEDLHGQLLARGRGYTRLKVCARTEAGEDLARTWRVEGLDAIAVTDRVRWQLEGWLTRSMSGPAPLAYLALHAEEVHPGALLAPRLWGDVGAAETQAARGAERAHSLLTALAPAPPYVAHDDGPHPALSAHDGGSHPALSAHDSGPHPPVAVHPGVYSPVEQGGRDPRTRIRLVRWGDEPIPERPLDRPWPGCLPDPAPATVPCTPLPAILFDSDDLTVSVSASLQLSGPPARLRQKDEPDDLVVGWAGPWPLVERWWAPDARRRVFLQLLTTRNAYLMACENSYWTIEGIYD